MDVAARIDVLRAVAALLPSGERPVRVAVDGITAAGKTTFARELCDVVRESGRPCEHVSMDGLHQRRAVRHRQGRDSAEGYYEDAYDFDALRRVLLDPLGPTGNGRYSTAVLDLATDSVLAETQRTAAPDLVVVVDGSFLQRPEVRDAWDVVIFLRASFESAFARGTRRDAGSLGSLAEAQRLFTHRYHAAQRRYLAEIDPEGRADVVVDHDDPTVPRLVRRGVTLS
jgi:uridine kinase